MSDSVDSVDGETILALRKFAQEAESAADDWTPGSAGEVSRRYVALREQAWMLARRNGWGTEESFSNAFPSVEQLALIQSLDHQLLQSGTTGPAPLIDRSPAVQRALRELAAWAIGVRMAGELHL